MKGKVAVVEAAMAAALEKSALLNRLAWGVRATSRPNGTVEPVFFQRQFRQQCLLNALNNLLGADVIKVDEMEFTRGRIARKLRRKGYEPDGYKPHAHKGEPGLWSTPVAVEVLNKYGFRVRKVKKGAASASWVRQEGLRGAAFLLVVVPPGSHERKSAHAMCLRGGVLLDGAREPMWLSDGNWAKCVHQLICAYQVE